MSEALAAGELAAVERLEGIGMTDYYGVSGRSAGPEQDQIGEDDIPRAHGRKEARG